MYYARDKLVHRIRGSRTKDPEKDKNVPPMAFKIIPFLLHCVKDSQDARRVRKAGWCFIERTCRRL